ncbi:hypothetical protein [Bacillus marinisedimentorum]|nr:hypothetical protein [Bacillus marinisedimentorum]
MAPALKYFLAHDAASKGKEAAGAWSWMTPFSLFIQNAIIL